MILKANELYSRLSYVPMMPEAWFDLELSLMLIKGGVMRSETIAQLSKRLGGIVSKRPSLTLWLWGEPGIGKTHTTQELLRQTPCHKLSVHATISSQALVALLPRPKNLPEWVENTLEKAVSLEQAATAFTAWLTALAPFVLYLEDAHEASEERLRWLNQLAAGIKRTRGLALIVTSRTPAPIEFEALRLEALELHDAQALLETVVGMNLPGEAIAWIFQHTQGNPLFTLEFFKHLARYGFLWSDGNRWRWRTPENEQMPSSVEAVIAQMLEMAVESEDARSVLKTRAMLGLETSERLWTRLSGLSPKQFQTAKHTLELHGIVRENQFVHPLFAEVALQSLTALEQQDIARNAIGLLENTDAMRAASFLEPAKLNAPEALALLEVAMNQARASGLQRQAADFLKQSVKYANPQTQGSLALEAAKAFMSFHVPQAEQLAQLAIQHDPSNIEAVVLRSKLLLSLNRADEAERLLLEVPIGAWSEQARLAQRFAFLLARNRFQDALDFWETQAALQEDASIRVQLDLVQVLLRLGQVEAAKTALQKAFATKQLSNLEQAMLVMSRAEICSHTADYRGAEQAYTSAIELLRKSQTASTPLDSDTDLTFFNAAISGRALTRLRSNQLDLAKEDLEQHLRQMMSLGDVRRYAVTEQTLGYVLIELAEYERAEEILLESHSLLEHSGVSRALVHTQAALALLFLEWHVPHSSVLALKYARASEQSARHLGSNSEIVAALYPLAWAESQHGQPSRTLEYADEIEALSLQAGQPARATLGVFVRGLAFERLGRHDNAIQALQTAVTQAIQTGHELAAERMGAELDRVSLDRNAALSRLARAKTRAWQNIVLQLERAFPDLENPELKPAKQHLESANNVQLEVLGSMRANGKPISDRNKKAKECIALLLEARIAGRREVAQLELLDSLYPDLTEDKALGALRQLVFRLRSSLGQEAILRGSAGYSLGAVSTDIEQFLETHNPSLWRGLYLEDLGEGWDSRIRDVLYDALKEVIKAVPLEAARLSQILLEANPLDLEVLKLCLGVRNSSGDQRGLSQWYAKNRERFLEVGETLPENWRDLLEY
jgi:AAA ATPase domain